MEKVQLLLELFHPGREREREGRKGRMGESF